MLKNLSVPVMVTRVRGFGLIEMMIAIVIGLIVIGGAISLIVAINKSNDETIQATRLTQELQALASVISDEIKRSRRIHDAYACVGTGSVTNCSTATNSSVVTKTIGTGANASTIAATDQIDVSTSGCIVYGYQDATLNDTSQDANQAVNNYRVISISNYNVSIMSSTSITAATCAANGVRLNSSQIKITGLKFGCSLDASGNPVSTSCSSASGIYYVKLVGQLTNGDSYTKNITRTIIQPIFVRSGAT